MNIGVLRRCGIEQKTEREKGIKGKWEIPEFCISVVLPNQGFVNSRGEVSLDFDFGFDFDFVLIVMRGRALAWRGKWRSAFMTIKGIGRGIGPLGFRCEFRCDIRGGGVKTRYFQSNWA